jgi:multidrug efflux pump subunit AcrA (membrane-fusion protein)
MEVIKVDDNTEKSAVSAAQPAVSTLERQNMAIAKTKAKKKKKVLKRIISIVVVLAILGGIAFGMYTLFKPKTVDKQILTDFVRRGSIQSTVNGSGVTKAKDATSITLTAGGTVLEVFVREGDYVLAGQELYTIDSSDALAAVDAAQKTVNNYLKQLQAITDSYKYLTVTADFSGTLLDTADISLGEKVPSGKKLAQLVDDSRMKLELYFSYAYKDSVRVGQSAAVSVPSTMSQLTGTVTAVDYINRVSPEGAKLFRVTVTVDNPGVLTADMGATAVLTDDSGEAIYPFDSGKLDYSRKTDIITKTSGEAQLVNLSSYAQVRAGEMLLKMSANENDEQLAALENQLKTAQETLDKAQQNLQNFNAVSPISGTVLSCALRPGDQVQSGTVAINIADTSVMTVEAQIDEINISYVKPGMMATIMQWSKNGQEMFMGTVESVSMEGNFQNGVSFFPAVIRVDNPDGRLMSGMYIDYSFVASQSDDTLLAPVQAVKYTESGPCVFLKTETKPDNALDSETLGFEVPAGFYAVPVSVGLSDNTSAEITSGVEEGAEVFMQYMTNNGNSFDGGGIIFRG